MAMWDGRKRAPAPAGWQLRRSAGRGEDRSGGGEASVGIAHDMASAKISRGGADLGVEWEVAPTKH